MRVNRKGFTLVELLAVLTVFSVLFGTVMFTLHAMFEINTNMRDRFEYDVQLDRLAAQLRLDAHEAAAVRVTDAKEANRKGTVLELSFPGERSIRYALQGESVERLVSVEDAIRNRESFPLQPAVDVGWEIDDRRATPLISAHITQQPGVGPDKNHTLKPIRISAAVKINGAAGYYSAH